MRTLISVVLLAVVGCNPRVAPDTAVDAAAFNACDPGSPGTGDSCSSGGGTTSSCFRRCNSNAECGGITQRCQFCNFGECKETAPGLGACRLACSAGAGLRPVWCDFGGCGEVLRSAGVAR